MSRSSMVSEFQQRIVLPQDNYPPGFRQLDHKAALTDPSIKQVFGNVHISDTTIMQTPHEVLDRGEVLTNPSQVEVVRTVVNSQPAELPFAYLRQEPTTLHLGRTKAVPYFLDEKDGKYTLKEFSDAQVIEGEDPRVIPDFTVEGISGRTYKGWLISTVVATPQQNNPAAVDNIRQDYWFGESLNRLEKIWEVKDLKNGLLLPLSRVTGDESDTRIDVFGRPHPDITYFRANNITEVTKDRIETATNLTKGFLPEGIHTGVNTAKSVPGHPNLRELDIHEAYPHINSRGKELHYRLGRYGLDLTTMQLHHLGVVAERKNFPHAEPKPPENDVSDYSQILYGSAGSYHMMLTGVSDRHIGLARVHRTK